MPKALSSFFKMKKEEYINPRQESIPLVARQLEVGHEVSYVPKGNDMLPLIRGGKDVVILYPAFGGTIRVGDVVFARLDGNNYALRRIVDRNRNRYYLLPDSDSVLDERDVCVMDNILGKVVAIQRGDKRFRPRRGIYGYCFFP